MLSVNVYPIRTLLSLSTRWYKERDASHVCPVTTMTCALGNDLLAITVFLGNSERMVCVDFKQVALIAQT